MPQTLRLPPPLSVPNCGKPMRLVTVEPYPLYTNLDLHNYACECGQTEGRFVAR